MIGLRIGLFGLVVLLAPLMNLPHAFAHEPNTWMCTSSAEWPSWTSQDYWGTDCIAPNGDTYGSVRGYNEYDPWFEFGDFSLSFDVYNGGDDDDEKCQGVVECTALLIERDGEGSHSLTQREGYRFLNLGYIVESMQISCFCY